MARRGSLLLRSPPLLSSARWTSAPLPGLIRPSPACASPRRLRFRARPPRRPGEAEEGEGRDREEEDAGPLAVEEACDLPGPAPEAGSLSSGLPHRDAQAAAAVCWRLSLRPLRERSPAYCCCPLLRSVASTELPYGPGPTECAARRQRPVDHVGLPRHERSFARSEPCRQARDLLGLAYSGAGRRRPPDAATADDLSGHRYRLPVGHVERVVRGVRRERRDGHGRTPSDLPGHHEAAAVLMAAREGHAQPVG